MWFDIVGEINHVRSVATGRSIRQLSRLNKFYGKGRWRKMKGAALVRLTNGKIFRAEVHWYEAHGIGKRELKVKKILEDLKT